MMKLANGQYFGLERHELGTKLVVDPKTGQRLTVTKVERGEALDEFCTVCIGWVHTVAKQPEHCTMHDANFSSVAEQMR